MRKKIYLALGVTGVIIVALVIFFSFRDVQLVDDQVIDAEVVVSTDNECIVGTGEPCFDENNKLFLIEDGATITIGVESESVGDALISKWDTDFPEHVGLLEYSIYNSENGISEVTGVAGMAKGLAPDVLLVVDNEVVGMESYFLTLHNEFNDELLNTRPDASVQINDTRNIYLPTFYEGMVFSYNSGMISELGFSLDDLDKDGLPDSFDSWDKIFGTDLGSYKGYEIREVYPISINEAWSAYSTLTSNGFKLFSGDTYGFGEVNFLEGLEFISNFAEQGVNLNQFSNQLESGEMMYRFDDYLNEEAYPFSLVGTWSDVSKAENINNTDFVFTKMPEYKGYTLSPLAKTKGFVINSDTLYPSAASHVLDWIYSDTFDIFVNRGNYIPVIEYKDEYYPNGLTDNVKQMGSAFESSTIEDIKRLPNGTRRMDVYYSVDITEVLGKLWDGLIDPYEAQTLIVDRANQWNELNN